MKQPPPAFSRLFSKPALLRSSHSVLRSKRSGWDSRGQYGSAKSGSSGVHVTSVGSGSITDCSSIYGSKSEIKENLRESKKRDKLPLPRGEISKTKVQHLRSEHTCGDTDCSSASVGSCSLCDASTPIASIRSRKRDSKGKDKKRKSEKKVESKENVDPE